MCECFDLQGLLEILSPLINPLNWLYRILNPLWEQFWCYAIPGLEGCEE